MKKQSAAVKAFEINKDPGIYGTFAEIGAGQETVNFFYRAGLASQTVAKSMSAYDMTVSDEIYGKQTRYVSKERLLTMLDREYRLLEKRLKEKTGAHTRFFVFAETAATGAQTKASSRHRHAWMGLRFQQKPLEPFNDIVFHVNCLDNSRLEQNESLGVLGVNLIHAGFHFENQPKRLISLLTENLSSAGKIEIQSLSCQGGAFDDLSFSGKKKSKALRQKKPQQPEDSSLSVGLNIEIVRQNLSPLAFFPTAKGSEFLSDSAFNKRLVIIYKDKSLIKNFQEQSQSILEALELAPCPIAKPSERPRKNKWSRLARELTRKRPFQVFSAFDPWRDKPRRGPISDAPAPATSFVPQYGQNQQTASTEYLCELMARAKAWKNQKTPFTVGQLSALCQGELPLFKKETFDKNFQEARSQKKPKSPTAKNKSLQGKWPQPLAAFFDPSKQSASVFHKGLRELCEKGFSVLTADDRPLDELRELISLYTKEPVAFIVRSDTELFSPFAKNGESLSESALTGEAPSQRARRDKRSRDSLLSAEGQGLPGASLQTDKFLLQSLGALFNGGTKLVVLGK